MNQPAAIIGNGASRQGFDLLKFRERNIAIWGCNALYREFTPDWLVMVDPGIADEVAKSPFPKDQVIIPPFDEQFEPAEANPHRPRMNAGMAAMKEAIKKGETHLICLGFDFLILEPSKSTSNLYDGTPHYGPETRANIADNANRVAFLHWFVNQHPSCVFTFIYPNGTVVTTMFPKNIRWSTYDDLNTLLAGPAFSN